MFITNVYFLSTLSFVEKLDRGGRFSFGLLKSRKINDGLLVKDSRGGELRIKAKRPWQDDHLILDYTQNVFGVTTGATEEVADELLATRIIDYMRHYYGERHTNCSTFVEYLRSGNFFECCENKKGVMFSAGMNRYTGQQIRPGDSLAVLFFNKCGGSRKAHPEVRKCYKKRKKVDDDLKNMSGEEYSISPEGLCDAYKSGYIADYHFMFCIGIKNGEPVFIQQMGRNDPKEAIDLSISPIIVTVGTKNIGYSHVPASVFIKKGRK